MFEKIKERWQRRIEKNAIESTLTYVDKKGIEHTETVFLKRSLLPLGDWTRIYPPLKEENGQRKIIWSNLIFGGWRNFVKTIFFLAIIGFFLLQFKENFALIEYYKGLLEIYNIRP